MNRLTTLGVLLVALLTGGGCGSTKTDPGTPPKATPVQTTAASLSPTPAPMPVATESPSTPWTVTTDTDKLTDKKLLTAATTSTGGDASQVYELTVKCDGASEPEVTVATFDRTNTTAGERLGRGIPWTHFASGATSWVASFRYRIDSGTVGGGMLWQTYNNAGSTTAVFRPPLTSAQVVAQWEGTAAQRAESQAEVKSQSTLPQTRLVVADLFPGETVEFLFNNLTAEQRTAMQTMCFPPPPEK